MSFVDFLQEAEINISNGRVTINLIDLFPMTRKGFVDFYYLDLLLSIYIRINGLSGEGYLIVLDSLLKKHLKSTKDKLTLPEIIHYFRNGTIFIKPIDDKGLLLIETVTMCDDFFDDNFYFGLSLDKPNLIKALATHPKINKLNIAVLSQDTKQVEKIILIFDPRVNSNEAYLLSLNKSNDVITKLLKDNIIIRVLLHKRLLRNFFGNSSLVNDMYNLMVELI